MYDSLLPALESGVTVLTVNNRLARSIRRQYNLVQTRRGCAAWPTAPVQMLRTWMDVLWREAQAATGDSRPVLGADEVAVLWERIVGESEYGSKLLQVSGTARIAADAWTIAKQWRIPLPSGPAGADHDFAAFIGWSATYRELLERNAWVDPADVPDLLTKAVSSGALRPPARIVLAGFSEFEPQIAGFLDALRGAGCSVELDVARPRSCEPKVVGVEDHAEEIADAARWARNLLDGGATGPIGVLVPDISAVRPLVQATFGDYLQPGAILPGAKERPPAFNISIGRPLSDWPVVHAAVLALDLCRGSVPMDRASLLLRTPFIAGGAEEISERAVLDAWLRRRGHATLSLDQLADLASDGGARKLAAALRCVRPICAAAPAEAAPSILATSMADILNAIGWPHGRTLGSSEYQAAEKFWEILARYSALDIVLPAERFRDGVSRLMAMMDAEIFQPTDAEAPVQILGLLEGVGQQFEHLWIAGLHDEIVPAAPSPNPFLPIALQRHHKVARSSSERELDFATKLVDGLFCSSEDIWISWPRNDGERQLRPSPLIARTVGGESEIPATSLEVFERIVHRSAVLETFVDEQAPAVEEETTEGGTWLLQDQAACPFRAFVRHRLHARPLESPGPGMDPRERGTLVHTVLQLIWDPEQTSSLRGHDELASLDDATLRTFVEECVDAGIELFEEGRPEPLAPRYRAIERERLAALIFKWMCMERERAPFKVVETEHSQQVEVGDLRINVRIDRIDELGDGRRVFIDYKTSKPYASKWRGERPDEPQLPIYCTTCDNVAAVTFGQLRAGSTSFIGFAEDDGILPGVRPYKGDDDAADWSGLMANWRRVLNALSAEFRGGVARVDPKKKDTCTYCDLELVCRVADGRGLDEAEVEE